MILKVGELKQFIKNREDDESVMIAIGGDDMSYGMIVFAEKVEYDDGHGLLISCDSND